MLLVVPMAGNGQRFRDKGYTIPKPFIPINGQPMIKRVIECFRNLYSINETIFICRRDQEPDYTLLEEIAIGRCRIVPIDGLTSGSVSTLLLAEKYINREKPILIANSDQLIEFDYDDFESLCDIGVDGSIFVFPSDNNPKWSYSSIKNGWRIDKVVEKQVIPNAMCNVGIYYWRRGGDFVDSALDMIAKDDRVNNEFYLAPTFNYLIKNGKIILPFKVNKMVGLGTPEDLEQYINMEVKL